MADRFSAGSGLASAAATWVGGVVPDPATDTITIGPDQQTNGPHIITLDVDWAIVLGGDAPFNLRTSGQLVIAAGHVLSVSAMSDTEIDGIIDLRAGGTLWWNDMRCHAGHVGHVVQRGERAAVRYGTNGFRIIGPAAGGGGRGGIGLGI